VFEEFVRLQALLWRPRGCPIPARKRPLPTMPRSIGLVTISGRGRIALTWQPLRAGACRTSPRSCSQPRVQGDAAPGELVRTRQALMSRAG